MPLRDAGMPGNDAGEEALIRGATVERVARTASTNDDLLARVRAAAAAGAIEFAPCLLVADVQTAGRGRSGRRWHSAPGRSLCFSLAWQPRRADLGGLSLAVGVAIADALDPRNGPEHGTGRIGIKWPNDLWLVDRAGSAPSRGGGRKLAGILVETSPLGAGRVAVIGVGVNIASHAVEDAASGVASLDEIDGTATAASTLARIVPTLEAALARFDVEGFAPFADRFAARDVLRGRGVVAANGEVAGVAAGIGADGALLVDNGGRIVAVTSGEWRLRIAAEAERSC
ncbi:MAG TPA: biotin--[acetyl-CoA-carboxylase] ligase [Caldimonas sp.]|nr:biotin--[acetyl-CoA-carboxylase] ligase [Caldimonas sp.]